MKLEEEYGKPINWLSYENCFRKYENIPSTCIIEGSALPQPFVSIMIPTYRRIKLLPEAIHSSLSQKSPFPYEVVVVDNDQSTEYANQVDELVQSFKSSKLRLFRNSENIGMFGNWNRCIELARGEWVTILNDDDLLMDEWLETMAPYLEGQAMQASKVEVFGENDWVRDKKSLFYKIITRIDAFLLNREPYFKVISSDLFINNPVYGSLGVLINRKSSFELGGFNEKFWPISDYVFNVRYALGFGINIVNKPLAKYRYSENESMKPSTMQKIVTNCFLFRNQLIGYLYQEGVIKNILLRINRLHAKIDAYKFYCKAGGQFDWRGILLGINVCHKGYAPGILLRILCAISWRIFACRKEIPITLAKKRRQS